MHLGQAVFISRKKVVRHECWRRGDRFIGTREQSGEEKSLFAKCHLHRFKRWTPCLAPLGDPCAETNRFVKPIFDNTLRTFLACDIYPKRMPGRLSSGPLRPFVPFVNGAAWYATGVEIKNDTAREKIVRRCEISEINETVISFAPRSVGSIVRSFFLRYAKSFGGKWSKKWTDCWGSSPVAVCKATRIFIDPALLESCALFQLVRITRI